MMPEMDGIALLKEALAQDKDMIAIIMTGEGTIVTAVEAMKSGAFDYSTKPFKALLKSSPVLSRALDMRQLRIQNAELAQRIKERTAELESANEELEAFSSSVSHDLRAPLRHIRGYADLLGAHIESTLDETSRGYLSTITGSARRLSQLIDELLAFSRRGRSEMHRGPVDMEALVTEVRNDLAPETAGRLHMGNRKTADCRRRFDAHSPSVDQSDRERRQVPSSAAPTRLLIKDYVRQRSDRWICVLCRRQWRRL